MGIKIDNAIAYVRAISNTNHGYSQINRWAGQGNGDVKITSALFKSIPKTGDFDCSSLVISAYQYAGVDVFKNGATYTGNMYNAFVKCGFEDITSKVNRTTGAGLQAGDVLLNKQCHTAIMISSTQLAQASISETGGITGKSGDQTGKEIHTRSYYSYPWDCVLRYAKDTAVPTYTYMYASVPDVNYRTSVNGKIKGQMRNGERVKILKGSDTKKNGLTWVKTSYGNWVIKSCLKSSK